MFEKEKKQKIPSFNGSFFSFSFFFFFDKWHKIQSLMQAKTLFVRYNDTIKIS